MLRRAAVRAEIVGILRKTLAHLEEDSGIHRNDPTLVSIKNKLVLAISEFDLSKSRLSESEIHASDPDSLREPESASPDYVVRGTLCYPGDNADPPLFHLFTRRKSETDNRTRSRF